MPKKQTKILSRGYIPFLSLAVGAVIYLALIVVWSSAPAPPNTALTAGVESSQTENTKTSSPEEGLSAVTDSPSANTAPSPTFDQGVAEAITEKWRTLFATVQHSAVALFDSQTASVITSTETAQRENDEMLPPIAPATPPPSTVTPSEPVTTHNFLATVDSNAVATPPPTTSKKQPLPNSSITTPLTDVAFQANLNTALTK